MLRGDVEIHLRKSGWEAHGHDEDSNYNRVVLHVILHPEATGKAPTTLTSGVRIPTAALFTRTLSRSSTTREGQQVQAEQLLTAEIPVTTRPLPLAGLPNVILDRLLDRAGDARFLQKSRSFKVALAIPHSEDGASPAPDEVLYQGLMVGLGYGGNGEAFLQIAQGLTADGYRSCYHRGAYRRAQRRYRRGTPPGEWAAHLRGRLHGD